MRDYLGLGEMEHLTVTIVIIIMWVYVVCIIMWYILSVYQYVREGLVGRIQKYLFPQVLIKHRAAASIWKAFSM